jgi:DNA repair protein RadC
MIILNDTHIRISNVTDVIQMLRQWFSSLDPVDRGKEHLIVIHLDTRLRMMRAEVVSIGIVNASLVHPREVFRRAIKENTVSLIMAHNHPSGICEPSGEDSGITARIRQSGEILGIHLIDHVIVSDTQYYSFQEHGTL